MTALTTQQIKQVAAAMQRSNLCPGAVRKSEFVAALTAEDAQIEAAATTLNSALPLPYRTAATAAQKAALVGCLALRRALVADADGSIRAGLRRLLA